MSAGLTCFICEQPLYPHPAERTDWGWKHAHGCATECAVSSCAKPRRKRQWCETHYAQWKRHGHVVDPADRLEDIEFMAATGESFIGAAARLDMTPKALEKFLGRHRRTDLRATLIARNPRDHNKAPDGSDVTALAATPAARERARSRDRANEAARRGRGAAA